MQNLNNLESSKYKINYTTEKFKEISQINETSESQDGGMMGLVPDNVRLNWDNTPNNRLFRFPDENFVTYAGFGVVDPNQETEWSDEAVSYAAERLAYAFISSVTKIGMGKEEREKLIGVFENTSRKLDYFENVRIRAKNYLIYLGKQLDLSPKYGLEPDSMHRKNNPLFLIIQKVKEEFDKWMEKVDKLPKI